MSIRWRASAMLALAYVITGEIGRLLNLIEGTTIFIWPPTAISLSAIMLFGPGLWPGAAAGTLMMVLLFDQPLTAAVSLAAFELGEVMLTWWLLTRLFHFRTSLARVSDVVALAAVGLGTSLMSACFGSASLFMLGIVPAEDGVKLFYSWWWSHISANLVIAPMLMTWWTRSRRKAVRPRAVEILFLLACVLIASIAMFSATLRSWLTSSPAPFYLLPLPLWAGLRFGPRGAATATFALGSMAIASVSVGMGPFMSVSELQGFVSVTSVATLLLSAMAIEKDVAHLRRSAIQLAALDAIVSVDAKDRIVEFNPAAAKLFGYRASDVLGKDVLMLIPVEHQARFGSALRADLATQGGLAGRRYRTWARRADGTDVAVELSIVAATFDGENIRTGFVRDRTNEVRIQRERMHAHLLLEEKVEERTRELMRINHELERSEIMLRQAEELAEIGSYELDINAGKLEWSDELYRLFGQDRATFTPTLDSFIGAVHPDDRAAVQATVESAIANIRPFSVEDRIVRPDGTVRRVVSRGKVFCDVDGAGHATRVSGCCQDITDRQAAEAARYRLADIAEASEDAIIGLTPQGEIETWNAGAAKIFGYTSCEVLGKSCTILAAEDSVPEVRERIRIIAAGRQLSHYELPHRRKDGSIFEASIAMSAIRDRHGIVIGLSKIVRDITEQKFFETQLKASLEEKEVLLREIHHRVKNNLQVISSLLNLQVSTETSPRSRRSLLESQNRIQSMALVHQLLYQSTTIGRVDVTTYIRTLTNRLLRTYNVGSDRIELIVDGPEVSLGIDRMIPCGLIVNELVANAIDHAFPGERHGHIWVTIRMNNNELTLSVRDDGIGIPSDLSIENVQTFGLQIARTLTFQLDGTISVASNNGTSVHVTFPVAPSHDIDTSASTSVH